MSFSLSFLMDLGVKMMGTTCDHTWSTTIDVVYLLQSFLAVTSTLPATLSRAVGA